MPTVVLRRLKASDWKDLLEVLGDEKLYEFLDGAPTSEEAVVKWLEEDQYLKLTSPGAKFSLAVEQQPTGKVIGVVYFKFHEENDREQGALSVYIGPKFQHQGFATEALEAILSFCFSGISLHRVIARSDSRNTAAIRLLEKVGMRREGAFIQSARVDGEWRDILWYAMLDEEYAKARAMPSGPK